MTKYNLKNDGSITNSQVTLTSFMIGDNTEKKDTKENYYNKAEECAACKSKCSCIFFI